jgi:hypothetical protein
MKTKNAISTFAAAALLTLGAASISAHNGVEHVMGTLSAKTDKSVTVETVKHTKVTVLLDPSTTFNFNDKTASANDLKVGERVVVNAKEGADEKLHGVSVRWGANSTSHDDHAEHSK